MTLPAAIARLRKPVSATSAMRTQSLARTYRQQTEDVKVLLEALPEVVKALQKGREYICAMHANIYSATGKHDNLVKPDLDLVDRALAALLGELKGETK